MQTRTVLLGSVLVGMIAGAVCALVLSAMFSPRLLVGYLFSVLVYGAAGGLGALVFSAVLVRVMDARRALWWASGLSPAAFVFLALVYWGNKWVLLGIPFWSFWSLVFDFGALVVSLLLGFVVAWGVTRGLSAGRTAERAPRLGRRVFGVALATVGAPAALLAGMTGGAGGGAGDPGGKSSVVLISIDALRADHLGCYGYERRTSPTIDRLAREGVKFEKAFCPEPSTGPSHATMLTGVVPQTHRLRRNGESLSDSLMTLAEILRDGGYVTAGFTTNTLLDDRFGFTQGFDTYIESGHVEKLRPVSLTLLIQTLAVKEFFDKFMWKIRGGDNQTLLCVGKWLRGRPKTPFFLFLHLLDPHWPYEPLEPYRSAFPPETSKTEGSLWVDQGRDPKTLARNLSLYDGEILTVDDGLTRFLSLLEQVSPAERTLIVFTADHGENLGDHEPYFRHQDVYDGSVQVPLILHCPGTLEAGRTVDAVVENSAIVPTILSLIGDDIPEWIEGESLVPLARGIDGTPDRRAFVYSGKRFGLRTSDWKVIIDFKNGERLLYDLAADPAERNDLFEAEEAVAAAMEERLLAEIDRLEGGLPGADEGRSPFEGLDRQTMERLKALGYVQ